MIRVTDDDVGELVRSELAVLLIARSDCGSCRRYEREIAAAVDARRLDGVALGKIVLDEPGCLRFKRHNRWLREVDHLPFTSIYANGERLDGFAASRASYLIERLERALRSAAECVEEDRAAAADPR